MYLVQVTPTPHKGMFPFRVRVFGKPRSKTRTYREAFVQAARDRAAKARAKGHHVRVVTVEYRQVMDTEFGPKQF